MDKKQFDFMDEAFKEKLKNCRDEKELQALLKASGMGELSDDQLDAVSGGSRMRCPKLINDITNGIEMPELPDEKIVCQGFFLH